MSGTFFIAMTAIALAGGTLALLLRQINDADAQMERAFKRIRKLEQQIAGEDT